MVTTRSAYIKQIDQLDGHVSVIGQAVVEDIRNTALAIGQGNKAAAQEVADGHDAFERLHRNVEDTCMSLMLLQQPMASDLRLVTASFRAISDLAREVADLLVAMADNAAKMVLQAVESFGSGDVSVAENVFVEDDTMDRLYEKVRKSVVDLLKAGEEPASVAPEILSVAKYYERMGPSSALRARTADARWGNDRTWSTTSKTTPTSAS